ncbi:hypothetical protein BIW11_03861, partial [Tropilaelaps mercedesae]
MKNVQIAIHCLALAASALAGLTEKSSSDSVTDVEDEAVKVDGKSFYGAGIGGPLGVGGVGVGGALGAPLGGIGYGAGAAPLNLGGVG